MMKEKFYLALMVAAMNLSILFFGGSSGCGNTALPGSGSVTEANFLIGGTIDGLSGTALLQNNGEDDLSIDQDGSFTFPTRLADGSDYDVTVSAPAGQTCSVSNGTGSVSGADVSNVVIHCGPLATATPPSTCGNGQIDAGEDCDPSASPAVPAGTDCTTLGQGFSGGTLGCKQDGSCLFDVSQCTSNSGGAVCGNGTKEGSEECDDVANNGAAGDV